MDMTSSPVYEKLEYLEESPSNPKKMFVRCNGFALPQSFPNFTDQIRKMEIRSDDVWLCGVPKSGTTWVQEAVWCIANYENFEKSKNVSIKDRFPFLEHSTFYDDQEKQEFPEYHSDSVAFADNLPSPRYIKTHLPFEFIPENLQRSTEAKIIYVARNPRDACISRFHFYKFLFGYKGNLEMFSKRFLEGTVHFLPYWDHVLPFWRIRDNPNVLFITYEEMKKDLRGGIWKIANFLGKTLQEEQIRNLIEHLSFENMKNNPMINREEELKELEKYKLIEKLSDQGSFMRCGQSGQWKETMTHSMVQLFEEWEQENIRDTGYSLTLDL